MATATCGHEVKEGISTSIYGFDRDGSKCLVFGTYCVKCILEYYEHKLIASKELNDLIKKLKRKTHFIKLENQNIDLKKDLREVLSSGAIHWVNDLYYNNSKQVEEAREIYKKHFEVDK